MALKATIYKADLQVADLDRSHFAEYALTIARHPSETDERMMVRLLAFAMYAGQDLSFGNLDIFRLSAEEGLALAALAERKMKLSCTIQEGAIYMEGVELHPQVLQASGI